ncbi:glycosyltransferase [Halosolutus halophilus]|uniref:glycosyltransferase n=1 Tax=Halosolutus halophilus TaxID=1552990 RepID=UPI0022352449|nr:glycosyltransferase [Halosolutus halophilus]
MTDESGDRSSDSPSNFAIAHWGEHANGGGDRLAWELARVFDDSAFYVGWGNESIEPDDINAEQFINGTMMNRALEYGGLPRKLAHLLGWQIASPLRDYDVLLTSGNEPLFYMAPDEQTWIAYIHHTNRRQSDQITEVESKRLKRIRLLIHYAIRVAFDHNTHKPDLFVVNSELVKRRVVRYWGVPEAKIRVVYPPVNTHVYTPNDAPTKDYYVTLSRLDWHKDIDGIVKTFNELDERLLIAGDGPERERLEGLARDNIEFLGFVDEDEKRRLLSGAKAFVFNGRDEDFGIAPVEALAAGTPLLGVDEGMTQYQVIQGKNGYKHTRSDSSGPSLEDTVHRFETEGVQWSETEITSFAERFSVDEFHEGIREVVAEAISRADTTPRWYNEYNSS